MRRSGAWTPSATGSSPRSGRRRAAPRAPRRPPRPPPRAEPGDLTRGPSGIPNRPGPEHPGAVAETTEPGTTEPGTTEPRTTEPGTTDPETTGQKSMAIPLTAFAVGAVVALLVGVFGRVHDPTLQGTTDLGYSTVLAMKTVVATVVAVLV